jgi:cytochrome c peroxidase
MRRIALPSLIAALTAAALAVSCSHEQPKPAEAAVPDQATAAKAAADKAAAEKAAADRAAAAAKAAADKEAADKAAALAAAVAALPPAPPLPKSPAYLGEVDSPKDNPTTAEKAALGWLLFFDARLSKDGSMKCESCHHVEQAWTSGLPVDPKVGGKLNVRNAPSMVNLGYHANGYYWDGRKATLEAVSEAAWTGQLAGDPAVVSAVLNANPLYRALFQRAFGGEASKATVPQALAAFLRALKSGDSPWDKSEGGDKKAASKQAKRGFELFKKHNCALCHAPPLYSDTQFHNTGIGWDADKKAFADHGRMDATKDAADDGRFKTPSLREVARTAPYFHDGHAKTLDEAIDQMAAGGVKNPGLDEKLKPAKLSKADKAAIKAFLESLSGTATYGTPATLPN